MQKNTSKSKNNLTIQPDNNAFGFTLFANTAIATQVCKYKQHILNRNKLYLKPKQ